MTATFLKDYREKRKISQEELSEELKIPVFTLRAYEQGKRRPSVDKAKELAVKMGCKWTDFF